ncbi:MAG: DUF5131 family protein [Acidobacteria bacterium]|nr:DUF5131 family protein [Acidobacteriota bacterium]
MNRTKIEWADYTWNPIKGLCPQACWYCYARRIYQRFKLDPKPWLDIAELNMTLHTKRTAARVFVCSTFELFSPVADGQMRDCIFDVIQRRPDLTFIILTKRPERIDRAMPDNVWLGVSVTGEKDDWRIKELKNHQAAVRFVSLEPFLGLFPKEEIGWLNWFIIGRLTGNGYRHNPARATLGEIRAKIQRLGVPLFEKNNLEGIWGDPLIQEYPK